MKDDVKGCGLYGALAVAILMAALLVGWGTSWFGLATQRPMAKYSEETRAQVYEESRTYNQGMAVDLDGLCRQRDASKDAGERAALADTIRLRVARYDSSKLPTKIQRCLEDVN